MFAHDFNQSMTQTFPQYKRVLFCCDKKPRIKRDCAHVCVLAQKFKENLPLLYFCKTFLNAKPPFLHWTFLTRSHSVNRMKMQTSEHVLCVSMVCDVNLRVWTKCTIFFCSLILSPFSSCVFCTQLGYIVLCVVNAHAHLQNFASFLRAIFCCCR